MDNIKTFRGLTMRLKKEGLLRKDKKLYFLDTVTIFPHPFVLTISEAFDCTYMLTHNPEEASKTPLFSMHIIAKSKDPQKIYNVIKAISEAQDGKD